MESSDFAGLSCGHTHHFEAASSDDSDRPVATHSKTDLRRARQHSREVVRTLQGLIEQYLREHGITLESQRDAQRLNEQLTRLASRTFREQLLDWLAGRRKVTMRRAVRAAFEAMKRAFVEPVPDEEFIGTPGMTTLDEGLLKRLNQIDAGLLYNDDDSLATETGNRITRSLRVGAAQQESMDELIDRVRYILTEGSAEGREESGVSGQTVKSKAELISHDSIQESYISAAHRRYLSNGFRYSVFDAVVDYKTTDICKRMNEHVIDLVSTPWLVPSLHPFCRSGIRPVLDIGDKEPLTEDDIADQYLNTIFQTRGYRPTVLDTEELYRPTTLTEQYTPA